MKIQKTMMITMLPDNHNENDPKDWNDDKNKFIIPKIVWIKSNVIRIAMILGIGINEPFL